MAINFPNTPVNGNTYTYIGIQYTYIKVPPTTEGYWAVKTPATIGVATPTNINEGTDNAKYVTPLGLNGSKYVREDESTGETVLNNSGLERLKTTVQGVEVTGSLRVNGAPVATGSANSSEVDAGVDTVKYIPSSALEGSSYVKQESGSFTPRLMFSGDDTGIAYSEREGWWSKTGKQVTVCIHFKLSSKGTSTGTASIEGLPFSAQSLGFKATGACIVGGLASPGGVVGEINNNHNDGILLFPNGLRNSILSSGNFNPGSTITISITYPVA